jgi:hypothetical protein
MSHTIINCIDSVNQLESLNKLAQHMYQVSLDEDFDVFYILFETFLEKFEEEITDMKSSLELLHSESCTQASK